MGCGEEKMRCVGPKEEDADLWIFMWEELHESSSRKAYWWRVEHVKGHRSKKGEQHMSLFEVFITEGKETAGEPAKDGAVMDGG